MVNYFTRLAALAAVIPAIFAAPTPSAHHLKIRNIEATDVIPDSYIVVYNDDVNTTMVASHLASISSILSKRDENGIGATYDMDLFKGYQVTADEAAIAEIAASPEVAYIEKDAKVYASALTTQTGAPYGLGRISHRDKGTTSYIYDSSAGSGITVYVVDTGIYTGHSQFGGRASFGANFISGSANTDENGHGTHCSGTIAGSTYGVAKQANLVAVKVLDASGSGSNSGVISGIQWVGNNAAANSVLSMSLGGSYSSAVNSAVRSTVGKGVTVVVAAGNDDDDASNYSPASESTAITVGAIDSNDNRASFSNYGSIVDVFGPGVNILSSWIGSTTATNTISGTSMATPHIAGLAAYLIALEGISTPAAVQSRIKALATSGKIVDAESTNNLIGYNGNGA
ncbi:probable alkaline protease (oryzin) [Phialocephala subalpina]|uniref:Probable alkaline protease (Oryzin) n=1 Tax=Phialocephala subalpina TaxID=576137 RepID=A0A1L7WRY1_9HELO|nr:probable alkaline protease (oryzin) [Phialocephala subalpina]